MRQPLLRILLGVASLGLAAGSVVFYVHDQTERAPAERFVQRFDVAVRRPSETTTLRLVPAADLGADVVADIALSDASGAYPLEKESSDLRARWLRAAELIDDEILAARELTLDAAAQRPGWALHWSLLGKLGYAYQYRHPLETTPEDAPQWFLPLQVGSRYAPGNDGTSIALAYGILERWPDLSQQTRHEAPRVFARALAQDDFAAAALPMIQLAIGRDEALALLPREPRSLRAAFASLAERHDLAAAVSTYRLWEQVEWSARVRALEELEERERLHDVDSLRRLTNDWLVSHPPADFDTPAGRSQVLRVLALTPNDREGRWQGDPRAVALRFLLDHRLVPGHSSEAGIETVAGGGAVGEAMSALDAVPDPMRARARLLAGDVFGAVSLHERSDTNGSLEWTPFLVDLARFRIAQDMPDAAQVALDNVARAASEECEVRLVTRQLARARGRTVAPDERNAPLVWSASDQLSICVDPDLASSARLVTTIDVESPALVSWGWNGGRRGTVMFPAGRIRASVPLAGLWGRNAFFVRTLAGGPARPVDASVAR